MARVWFYNIPYHGHVNPTLPLVSELMQRGETVTYYSTATFAKRIEAAGAEFREYSSPEAVEQSRKISHTIFVGSQVAEATYAVLPEVLAAVESERPDYIIFDMSAPWGNIAARRFGIPSIASFPHFPFYWRTAIDDRRVLRNVIRNIRPGFGYWRRLVKQTRKIVKDYKLRKLKDINVVSSSAEMNIVFSSRYFQPYESHYDASYIYVGPIINTKRDEEPIPIRKESEQKLVYIAVGTVYKANLQFFRDCFQAFSDPSYAVILSVGSEVDPADLEPIPGNFTVAQYVPQLAVLKEADLFITHGGMNSIAESITFGVPMVVVPNTLEQSINAAQIEKLKAGLYIEQNAVSDEKLRQAAGRILADGSLHSGIGQIHKSFQEAGGVQRAADEIESFKRSHDL